MSFKTLSRKQVFKGTVGITFLIMFMTSSIATAQTIRIGGIGPLSAPGAVVGGIAMQWTMNLAVKDINEKGGRAWGNAWR